MLACYRYAEVLIDVRLHTETIVSQEGDHMYVQVMLDFFTVSLQVKDVVRGYGSRYARTSDTLAQLLAFRAAQAS